MVLTESPRFMVGGGSHSREVLVLLEGADSFIFFFFFFFFFFYLILYWIKFPTKCMLDRIIRSLSENRLVTDCYQQLCDEPYSPSNQNQLFCMRNNLKVQIKKS